jgi:spermidine synthase
MSALFQELDFRSTPLGDLSLRRRRDLKLGQDVFEIKLGDDFLMSSAFTASEITLADLGLQAAEGEALDVVVGGLGLGYTAHAVLASTRVRALVVVDALDAVIDWHKSGLLPGGKELAKDPRCQMQRGDFFQLIASETGFDRHQPKRRFDAILVDIDHSPSSLLDDANQDFYQPDGLAHIKRHLKPKGVFGLWSNDPPEANFTDRLATVFAKAWAEPVRFHNPLQDREETQTVYLAQMA